MIEPAFEIYQKLIVDYRLEILDLETFTDDISEMSSDPDFKKELANRLLDYNEFIYDYSFSAIKRLTEGERDEIYIAIVDLVSTYLREKVYEPDRVFEKVDDSGEKSEKEFEYEKTPQSDGMKSADRTALFCEVCGEMVAGYYQLDEHLGSMHPEMFLERFFCSYCGGMWLTIHKH